MGINTLLPGSTRVSIVVEIAPIPEEKQVVDWALSKCNSILESSSTVGLFSLP
jgi:hypothetical protein